MKRSLIPILILLIILSFSAYSFAAEEQEDWRITTRVEISKDGKARVSLEVDRSVGEVTLYKEDVKNLSIDEQSKDCLTLTEGRAKWRTDQCKSIAYSVSLGHLRGSIVEEKYILFRTQGMMMLFYWDKSQLPPPTRYLKVVPPEVWNVASPGDKVSENKFRLESDYQTLLREIISVGDFNVLSGSVDGTGFRVLKLPGAGGSSAQEIFNFAKGIIPELNNTIEIERLPVLLVQAPSQIETDTTTARDHTAVFNDNFPLDKVIGGGSIAAHELTHTFQHPTSGVKWEDWNWFQEGSASYFAFYLPWKTDYITDEEFRKGLQAYITKKDEEIGQPIEATAREAPYKKGAAVISALDMDIRARTGGDKTLADVLRLVYPPDELSLLAALETVVGMQYDDFYSNYVKSSKFPQELLAKNFSLKNPVTVPHSPTDGLETFSDQNKDAGTLKPGESKVTQVVKVADNDKNSDSISVEKKVVYNEGTATGADVKSIKVTISNESKTYVAYATVESFPVEIPTNDLSPFPDDVSSSVDITPTVADNPTDGHTLKTKLTVKYTEGGKSFTSSATDGVAETITSDGTDVEITIGDDYSSFGKPAKLPVKLTKAPNGLWSFNLKLSVADTSVAKFIDASISDKFSSSSHVVEVTNDGTRIRVAAGDFGENIGTGATDIHLADLELEIQAKETTTVSVKKVVELLDDGGSSIDAATTDTGEVGFISCPKVKGGKGPPKSHHGKPELLDDVDGNGKTNSFDAFILFKAIAKGGQVVTGKQYSHYFDFNKNDDTNSFDAFVLFKAIAKGNYGELGTRKTVDRLKTSRSSLGNSKGVRVIEVKMDEAPKGLVGHKLTLNAPDGTIEAIEPGAFDGATVTEGLGSSQATVAACDFHQKVEPGAKGVTLARVRVKGGSTVELKPSWLDDDSGGSYDLNNVDLNLKQVKPDSIPLKINDVSAYPNPANGQDSVTFRVNGEGIASTELQVFTSSGRKIYNSGFVTGNSLSWSTKTDQGRKVSSGIYLYALTVKGINGRTAETKVKRLLILR